MRPTVRTRVAVLTVLLALPTGSQVIMAEELPANATTKFLGARAEWKDVSIVVQHVSPLVGSREYYISGSGEIVAIDVTNTSDGRVVESRYEFKDQLGEANALIEKIIRGDVLDTRPEELDRPPPTCSSVPILILRNGKGEVRSIPFPRAKPTAAYEVAWLHVASLDRFTRLAEPVYRGAVEAQHVPKGFEWSAAKVLPGKQIKIPPRPTAEERARAEKEYSEKVEIQLKEIERVQAAQKEAKERD